MNLTAAVSPYARSFASALALAAVLLAAPAAYAQVDGVSLHQKISYRHGTFPDTTNVRLGIGRAAAYLGDLDGDGRPEMAIGNGNYELLDNSATPGVVWIASMNDDGTVHQVQRITTGQRGLNTELQTGSFFGGSIANLGDLNRDGVTDIAVGAPFFKDDALAGKDHGQIYILLLNPDGTVLKHQTIGSGAFFEATFGLDKAEFGRAIAPAGDVDEDGVPDMVISVQRFNGTSIGGALYIAYLNDDGTVKSQAEILPFPGDNFFAFGHFGAALANLGDVDGNGLGDLAVGAPTATGEVGAVRLLMMERDERDQRFGYQQSQEISEATGGFDAAGYHHFGEALTGLGDLDGDGVPDLAVSAPGDGGTYDEGEVWVLQLKSNGAVAEAQRVPYRHDLTPHATIPQQFGTSLATLGDLDGDGTTELAVGLADYWNSFFFFADGGISVVSIDEKGSVQAQQDVYSIYRNAESALPYLELADDDAFGRAVVSPGDLDGDGLPDLIVGAPGSFSGEGAFWRVTLQEGGWAKTYTPVSHRDLLNAGGTLAADDAFGSALAVFDDLDRNGVADLAVGAPGDDDGERDAGAVWMLSMTADGQVALAQKISAEAGNFKGALEPNGRFGEAVATLGDVNGDGVADLAVGSPLADGQGQDRGGVWILFMNADGTVLDAQLISDIDGGFRGDLADADQFGAALAAPGDLNGDGVPDLAVGAPGRDREAGAVFVLYLNEAGIVQDHAEISSAARTFTAAFDGGRFGAALAEAGDLNDDGRADLLVGGTGLDDAGVAQGTAWILFLDAAAAVVDHRLISDTAGGFRGTINAGDAFAAALTRVGDLNGDGVPDLAAGAPGHDEAGTDRGAAWVLLLEGTAVEAVTATLTVASAAPDAGVAIAVTPTDTDGAADGTTIFTRRYDENTSVTLTAPPEADGNPFQRWLLDGAEATAEATLTLTMDRAHTATAVYQLPAVYHTVTVASSNPDAGVAVAVAPADTSGIADGTTDGGVGFARTYTSGTVVSLTAPAEAGGNPFLRWLLDGAEATAEATLTLVMDADYAATAVYDTGIDPGGCPWTATPTNAAGVFLGRATIDGTPADDGDCVAAFDAGGTLAGVNNILFGDGIAYITLALYGDDPGTEDDEGLVPGEAFSLKLYHAATGEILSHSQVFTCWQDTNGAPIGGCGDVSTDYDFSATAVQTFALADGWNLITPALVPDAATPEAFFAPLEGGSLITATGSDCDAGAQFYDPALPDFLHTLAGIAPGRGYWARLDGAATLSVPGAPLAVDFSIDLCAGWNLVGYWPAQGNTPAGAFDALLAAGVLEVVTGFDPVAGAQFYDPSLPDFLSTLASVTPGRGYWVKVAEAVAGFQYPSPPATKQAPLAAAPAAPGVTLTNAFMFVHGRIEGDHAAGAVIEIATAEGLVVGAAPVRPDGTFGAAAVYGDDPTTAVRDGAADGEALRLRYRGEVFETDLRFHADRQAHRVEVAVPGAAADLPRAFTLDQNYPNPFNPQTTIRYGLPEAAAVHLVVFNALGQRVAVLVAEDQAAGWHEVAFAAGRLPSGLYLYRLEAGSFTRTGRMMLVR